MSNQAVIIAAKEWSSKYPQMAQREIDESTWNALSGSIFPGAKESSILMAVDYCRARELDILMKPVHIVPMRVKDAGTGEYNYRDIIMPGVGLYRIQAERTGNYAGADAPDFGDEIVESFTGKDGKKVEVAYPKWCKYTVYKLLTTGERAPYSAIEYWTENYAVQKPGFSAPNAMWKKRPRGQLAKCAEAQALRRAWPEIGQSPVYEEMAGKDYSPANGKTIDGQGYEITDDMLYMSAERFDEVFPQWEKRIISGDKTADNIVDFIRNKGHHLTEVQLEKLRAIA